MSMILSYGIGKGVYRHIIQSLSDHVTVFDICGGNLEAAVDRSALTLSEKQAVRGNYRMCKHTTNPVRFLKDKMKPSSIFRFILSHPDMDHLDGFNNLFDEFNVWNFWDSGVRRDKPDFSEGPYKEGDWDRYIDVRDGEDPNVVSPRARSRSKYFNKDEQGDGGDYIYSELC